MSLMKRVDIEKALKNSEALNVPVAEKSALKMALHKALDIAVAFEQERIVLTDVGRATVEKVLHSRGESLTEDQLTDVSARLVKASALAGFSVRNGCPYQVVLNIFDHRVESNFEYFQVLPHQQTGEDLIFE